ncbi:Ubiquitin-associated protein [Thalictrum thalictroides]|uniref:Ubiquitin-associated protein n=1 Tax=Thalictrum thalictroides TaxID=46969 RepID=A0A7J6X7I9_THATH|nr:Ubiquitin-associated protein [Thalictrum thalictroides]
MWSGYRRSGTCLRCLLVVFVIGCALYITGPSLFSRFKKGFMLNNNNNAHSCLPCTCDCPPSLSLMNIAPGLVNLTVTECGKEDPELNKEMETQFVDRLTDELKLHKAVAEEHAHHMNMTYIAARMVASQYQKEAEKCNTATETCEEAREQIEALLIKERKKTSAWEHRARKLGWEAS